MNTPSTPQASKNSGALAIAIVLALQFALVSWTFPISDLLSEVPLFHIDGAYHWYQIEVARELARQGRLTGYDPNFAAGYIGGVTLNASAKFQALVAICLGSAVSTTVAYKLTVFSLAVLGPAMVPFATVALKPKPSFVWVSAVLGLCLWWASGFRWFHTAGMSSFVFAAYLGLAFTALLLRAATQTQSAALIVALGLVGALGLFIHPLFPIIIALALPAFLVSFRRDVKFPAAIMTLIGIAVVSAIPNVPWAIAMAGSGVSELGTQPFQRTVDPIAPFRELIGIWGPGTMGSKLFVGLLAASVYSALCATDTFARQLARAGLLAWFTLTVFAHVGGAVPRIGSLQPNRFSSVAYLFLLPSSAAIVPHLVTAARGAVGLKRLSALGTAGIISISVALSIREVAREVSYSPTGHYGAVPPEVQPLGPKSSWLLGWLKQYSSPEGRVLFETSKGRIHDGAHIAGYLAAQSGREFIGGPYPFMFAASAWDGYAFGKPIESVSVEDFQRYLDLYNVGWIIAHSEALKRFVGRIPNILPGESFDDLSTFRVGRDLSYFLQGSGRLQRQGINRLELSAMTGADVVIKFHYVAGLKAVPPLRIEPFSVPGDAQPFVRLVSPPHGQVRLFVD